jgi:hypothetical protein
VASSALINYLQEECEASFADLSFLKKWYKVRTQPELFFLSHLTGGNEQPGGVF